MCGTDPQEQRAAGRSFLWAAHYCAALATYPGVVTRRAGMFPPFFRSRHSRPGTKERRNPPLFGLAPCGVYPATAIAGGAVRSYRTFSPLPRRQAGRYVLCGTGRQRPFERRRPDVIRHTALWSSDFPLRACARSDRPAQQLTRQLYRWEPGFIRSVLASNAVEAHLRALLQQQLFRRGEHVLPNHHRAQQRR